MSEPTIIVARSSSLPTLGDCAARWFAQQVEGMNSPPGPRTVLGSALHHSTAVHDQHIIDADPLRVDETAGAVIDYLSEHASEVDWRGQEDDDAPLRRADCERIGVALHSRYCTEIAPTRIYTAVEPTLGALEIETESGVIVRLTGQADREREEDGAEITSDLKSSSSAVSAAGVVQVKGHAFQLASYKLLRRASSGKNMHRKAEIIGLNTGRSPASQRVGVGVAEDVEETLLGTDEKPGLLHALGWYAKHGVFIGNPKSTLCTPKFCPAYNACHWRK